MPMDAREIETMIKEALPDAQVTIRDLAGDGDHYAAEVVSEQFVGKSRVQQHQLVYGVFHRGLRSIAAMVVRNADWCKSNARSILSFARF